MQQLVLFMEPNYNQDVVDELEMGELEPEKVCGLVCYHQSVKKIVNGVVMCQCSNDKGIDETIYITYLTYLRSVHDLEGKSNKYFVTIRLWKVDKIDLWTVNCKYTGFGGMPLSIFNLIVVK